MAQDRDETQFDDLLGEFFADRLDSQLGQAAARFEAELAKSAPSPWRLSPGRVLGVIAAGALAASVAWAAGGVAFRSAAPIAPHSNPTVAQADIQPVSYEPRPVERRLDWDTEDAGAGMLADGTPVRRIRRQETTFTRWIDPDSGARIEVTTPRQQLVLLPIRTY